MRREEGAQPRDHHRRRVFAAHRQGVLAGHFRLHVATAQERVQRLFEIVGGPLLHHQHRRLAEAEARELVLDDWIGDVQDIDRDRRLAIDIGKAKLLQRAQDAVEQAAERDNPDRPFLRPEDFVELAASDELHRSRPALLELLLLVQEGGRRQPDAVDVARRIFERLAQRESGFPVVLGDELSVHVTGANAHFQHDRRVRGLRELKTFLDHPNQRRQIGPRIEKPDLRLHGVGVTALLHD